MSNKNELKSLWGLCQDNHEKNTYTQWKWIKNKHCHYGLEVDKFTNIFATRKFKQSIITEEVKKNIEDLNNYLKDNRDIVQVKAAVIDKLVIGLGNQSVFETDIKLHHTYGIPYIPASSIKGCLRSHIIEKYFDRSEKKAQEDQGFARIFGGKIGEKNYEGGVIFFDAFPTKKYSIENDIMTPHYPKEYKDNQTILPIPFLVVKDTEFMFLLAITKRRFAEKLHSKILEETEKLADEKEIEMKKILEGELKDMLENHGIGAKTSVGYGYFKA